MRAETKMQGDVACVSILPDTDVERRWLQRFVGGGGPANTWDFLRDTERESQFRVLAIGVTVDAVEIRVANRSIPSALAKHSLVHHDQSEVLPARPRYERHPQDWTLSLCEEFLEYLLVEKELDSATRKRAASILTRVRVARIYSTGPSMLTRLFRRLKK